MKLKKFMLTTELVNFLLPLCIISLAVFYITTTSLREDAIRKNNLIARSTADQLQNLLQMPGKQLQQAHEAKLVAAGNIPLSRFLDTLFYSDLLFQKFEIISKNGKLLEMLPLENAMIGIDRSGQDFFHALQSGKTEYWSNSFISLPQGTPSVVLALPFSDYIVATHLNLGILQTLIQEMQSHYGQGMSIAVVDETGVFISHPDKRKVLERQTCENFWQLRDLLRTGQGEQGLEDKKNRILQSFAQIENTGWYVIVSQSTDSAFATVNKLQWLFFLIALSSLTVAVVASSYKTAFVLRSFAKVETALIQARDDLEVKVELRTKELFTANRDLMTLNEKMATVNQELHTLNTALSEEIIHREQAELALLQSKERLEEKVAERTKELFAANTELQTTIQEVKAEISARKLAEKTLDESEARYRAVIEQSPEAVLLCDPDSGEILEANSRFTERFGYDLQAQGTMNLFDLNMGDNSAIKVWLDTVKQSGFLPVQRHMVKHRNGTFVDIEVSGTLVRYGERILLVQTFRDVSEKVRHELEHQRDAHLAVRVQTALLSLPEPSPYINIEKIYNPFGYVGGDLYFLDWRYDGSLLRGFLIDVAGHGLGTALHTASLHVLVREVNECDLPLSDSMRWINRRAGDYFDEATFAGALGFEIDLVTRQLRWSCAGLPEVWMSTRPMTGVVAKPGLFWGLRSEETFETHTIPIEIGDSFYFMTDGLSDQLDREKNLPLHQFRVMVDLLRYYSEAAGRRDDATALCLHIRALPVSPIRQDGWPRIIHFNGYGDYQRLKIEIAKILTEMTGLSHSLEEVAVHEALANAMECRDGVPRQHKAHIRFNKLGKRLIVRVKTSRIGFAGNAILRRLQSHPEEMFAFGEDSSMGRGIPLMLSIAHRMVYNSEGTEVLLAWKLK